MKCLMIVFWYCVPLTFFALAVTVFSRSEDLSWSCIAVGLLVVACLDYLTTPWRAEHLENGENEGEKTRN